MPAYTLNYFNGRGRAEICRMLFEAAGVQYNDKRIDFAEWNYVKSKMPGCMLPVLDIDNKIQIPQSMAISRFLAREFGFHGKNNLDMARVEFITDCLHDLFDDYMRMYYDKDGKLLSTIGADISKSKDAGATTIPDKPKDVYTEMRMRYLDTCRRILPFLEKTMELYNGGNQFFVGEQIMMCDMMLYCALENPLIENPLLLKDFPKLQALRARVAAHPKVTGYLKKRKITEF